MSLVQNTETVTIVVGYTLELSPEELAMLYVILGNVYDGVTAMANENFIDYNYITTKLTKLRQTVDNVYNKIDDACIDRNSDIYEHVDGMCQGNFGLLPGTDEIFDNLVDKYFRPVATALEATFDEGN